MVLECASSEEEREAIPLAEYLAKVQEESALFAEGKEFLIAVSEGALGDHVKEGRELFAVYADKSELKLLLSSLCEMEEDRDL